MLVASAPSEVPASTTTLTAEKATVQSTVSGKGAIVAAATADASFQSAGTITSISVSMGQTVAAGQQLATIDPAAAQRELEKATTAAASADRAVNLARDNAGRSQASLSAAQQALNREQSAPAPVVEESGDGGTSTIDDRATKIANAQQSVREAEAAVASAEAAVLDAVGAQTNAAADVAAAQAAKDATVLVAPIAGVVTAINGTVGTTTTAGEASAQNGGRASASSGFVQISDTSSWHTTIAVSEADVSSVQAEQSATVTMAGSRNEQITGRVVAVSPIPTTSSEGVVSYAVSVALDSAPAAVRIGRTGFVTIVVAEAKDVVALPSEAVTVERAGEGSVQMRDKNGNLATLDVKTGLVGGGMTEIKHGLKPGSVVEVTIPRPTDNPGDSGGGEHL
ncbi:efflux RND transporter periplasmic adaptor subunit [Microbacterium keratanolyticum]|uniref:efflux RND transporter periplasmic adaptor subunit n=1 Tax=Microbacterium keratanolyticum TaxID=67574 RepID=UPI00363EF1A9